MAARGAQDRRRDHRGHRRGFLDAGPCPRGGAAAEQDTAWAVSGLGLDPAEPRASRPARYVVHVITLRGFETRSAALRSQYPMLVLMVGYTMVSLWIIAQPIVETTPRG